MKNINLQKDSANFKRDGSFSGSMNEREIRKIVKDEMDKNYRSGAPQVPRHTHDDVSNTKFNSNDIIFPHPINGSITMSQQTTYTLNLTGRGPTPSLVTFYGGALNTTDSPHVHAMIIGNAQYGVNQQFQPSTPTTVVTGPVIESIIQGSASITMADSVIPGLINAVSIIKNSQGHIIFAQYPSGTTVAQANVTYISNSKITVEVTKLATNWSISGLWTIT